VGDVEGSIHGISFSGLYIVMLNLSFYSRDLLFMERKAPCFCNIILLSRVRVNCVRSVSGSLQVNGCVSQEVTIHVLKQL
jgi:hypothetical protein